MSKDFKLAVIGGDGIGPEVVAEGLKVLDAAAKKYGASFSKKEFDLGARLWHKTGETLPDAVLEELKSFDVILLGAVGDPSVPSGVLERGLLLKLRFAFDHYINLRPARLYPGTQGPLRSEKPIDFIVVRELVAERAKELFAEFGTMGCIELAEELIAMCKAEAAMF